MKLENLERAVLSKEKVLYLLTKRERNDKSKYFKAFGFTVDQWERLRESLIEQAKQGNVVLRRKEFDFEKIEVIGEMPTPDNRNPTVKTVWYIDEGTDFPRFITAIPHKQ